MSVRDNGAVSAHTRLKELELAFQQAAVGGKNQMSAHFSEAYPTIELHLAANVSQKAALDIFNAAYGYKLHPPRFRKMLFDERKRRAEIGDEVVCTTCGQQLPVKESVTEEVRNTEGQ
jgi:hypothetical protein